jgi:hypothetical protein
MCFSSAACVPFRDALAATGRRQVVLAGIETHVCVLQTALELAAAGHSVYVVEDAVSSRQSADRQAALERMSRHGIERITAEMAVFEWLREAGTPEFKELQALIKARARRPFLIEPCWESIHDLGGWLRRRGGSGCALDQKRGVWWQTG